jgi:hypothetical protein
VVGKAAEGKSLGRRKEHTGREEPRGGKRRWVEVPSKCPKLQV